MVQFFFGILWTKSEPIDEEKGKEEQDEWFPTRTEQCFYYYNNVTHFSTVHWRMWAFKTKLRSSKISFGVSVEHPTRKHRLKHPWGVYSSKNGSKFCCVSRGNLWATLFWPGPLRIPGYWPKWRPSTEVNF